MTTETPTTPFNRKKAFSIFFGLLSIIALGFGIYWWKYLNHFESTDNAYVAAPQIQLSAQAEGTIASVNIVETQQVKSGDVLIKIDPTEAEIASKMADADLLKVIRESRSAILLAKEKSVEIERLKEDLFRRQSLKGLAAVPTEEVNHLEQQYKTAQNAYKEAFEIANGIGDVAQATHHPDVQKAIAAAKKSYITFLRTNVVSPVDAVVAKRNVQVGEHVLPGKSLLNLVISSDIWIDANFKEDQLRNIRVGQPAKIEADIYGGKVIYQGKVIGFSPETGSSMSLLPPQNATGNWVKVVQRLPVRIAIDQKQLTENPLQVGLSLNVTVDTSNPAGEGLSSIETSKVTSTSIYEKQAALADTHIQHLLNQVPTK
jgi:membrane fusion protein (multidrug efflux system)